MLKRQLSIDLVATSYEVSYFVSMEEQQQHDGMRVKHRRKRCGHCDEVLSYSAYRAHKDLYYNKAEGKWRRCKGYRDQTAYLDSSDSMERNEIAGMLANLPPNHEFQDQEVSDWLAVEPSAPDEPASKQFSIASYIV